MFKLRGTLTSLNTIQSPTTLTDLRIAITDGPAEAISSSTQILVPETGYYIISCYLTCNQLKDINSSTSLVLCTRSPTETNVEMPYRSETYPNVTENTGTIFKNEVHILKCFFLKVKDIVYFKWINNSGVSASCSGFYNMVKINPIYKYDGTLTDTASAAVNVRKELTLTLLRTSETITNNQWLCPRTGLYLITLYLTMDSTVNTTEFYICINAQMFRFHDTMVNKSLVGTVYKAYQSLTSIVAVKYNSLISFSYINTVVYNQLPKNGIFTIVLL